MRSFVSKNNKLLTYWCRDNVADILPNFYTYPDSDPTAMLRVPWATSLRCHGALGVPTATLRCVSCDAMVTCFHGDLTALVLSRFKTWRRPRRLWRPYCDLQRCHGALWGVTTTQRRSAAIGPILQIAGGVTILCGGGISTLVCYLFIYLFIYSFIHLFIYYLFI